MDFVYLKYSDFSYNLKDFLWCLVEMCVIVWLCIMRLHNDAANNACNPIREWGSTTNLQTSATAEVIGRGGIQQLLSFWELY